MLAGRIEELAQLRALVRPHLEHPGSLRVVQIDGPIGIGKSALLAAVIAGIPGPVHLARGESTPGVSPLSSQRSLVESLMKMPLEDAFQEETVHTLAAKCATAMDKTPTVIVIDDAQWLSPAAQDFLSALIQAPRIPALTLVLAHRIGQVPETVLATARRLGAQHEHYTVPPLSSAAVEQLLADLPPHQASSIAMHAKGNPLFIQLAASAVKRHPQASDLREALRFENQTQSKILSTAIADDVASIPSEAREVLETAAVLADSWTPENGFNVFSGEREHYERILALLQNHGLFTGHEREVMHPVVRFCVYHDIPAQRRYELHRAAASQTDIDILTRAEHLFQLGSLLTEKEATLLIRGAKLMLGLNPADTVRLLTSLPEQLRTGASETLLASAEIMCGGLHPAIARLRSLTRKPDSDPEALILLADALRMVGEVEESRALLQSSPHPDTPLLLRERIDVAALIEGHVPPEHVAALRAYPEVQHQRVADIYDTMNMLATGNISEARRYFESIPTWVRGLEQDVVRDCIHAISCAAWCSYILDEHEDALQIADRGLAVALKYGRATALPNLTTARAFILMQLGRLTEAEEAALYARSRCEAFGSLDLAAMASAAFLCCSLPRNDRTTIAKRYQDLASMPLPRFGWWRHAVVGIRVRASTLLGAPEPYEPLLNAPLDALTGMRHADIALAAWEAGNHALAKEYLSEGLALTQAQKSESQQALIYLAQATIDLANKNTKQLDHTLEQLNKAREIFAVRNMGLQKSRADFLLASLRERNRRANTPWEKLTPRERQVAEHVIQGATNQQIASHLKISIRTVEDHTANILNKLDAPSRARAAAVLAESRSTS